MKLLQETLNKRKKSWKTIQDECKGECDYDGMNTGLENLYVIYDYFLRKADKDSKVIAADVKAAEEQFKKDYDDLNNKLLYICQCEDSNEY